MKGAPQHGGNVYRAARQSGRPVRRLIDFSASINPLGPSPAALRAWRRVLPLLVHYPDPDCVALREALARRWRLDPEAVLIGNGSTELIHLLPRALEIRHALLLGPTFSEYEAALRLAGARASYLHARRREEYRPPVERLLQRLARGRPGFDTLFLCNPNSPTGRAVPVEAVRDVVRAAAGRGIRVVVDETFVDYCLARSVLPEVTRAGNLVVLRSFTKFYALPALRLGWLAAPPGIVGRLRALQPPWSVNMAAQVMAEAALGDRRHAARSLEAVQRGRQALVSGLAALPGVTVFPSEANFLLVELPAARPAGPCARRLAAEGLLIRDCSQVAGLNDRTIRVAVGKPAHNRRLLAALRRWLGGQR